MQVGMIHGKHDSPLKDSSMTDKCTDVPRFLVNDTWMFAAERLYFDIGVQSPKKVYFSGYINKCSSFLTPLLYAFASLILKVTYGLKPIIRQTDVGTDQTFINLVHKHLFSCFV